MEEISHLYERTGSINQQHQQVMSPQLDNLDRNVKVSLPIFSGKPEAWLKWSTQFKAIATRNGFHEDLKTQEACGDSEVERSRQCQLYSLLVLHTDGEAFSIVARITEEAECAGSKAWLALKQRYEADHVARKSQLQVELFSANGDWRCQ